MARNYSYQKTSSDEVAAIRVTCATDVTDTRHAYRLSDDSNEVAVRCGDDELCVGFPDSEAKAGEPFNLLRVGDFKAIASGSGFATANNVPWTTAASGGVRASTPGTDKVQGYSKSTAADTGQVTVTKSLS